MAKKESLKMVIRCIGQKHKWRQFTFKYIFLPILLSLSPSLPSQPLTYPFLSIILVITSYSIYSSFQSYNINQAQSQMSQWSRFREIFNRFTNSPFFASPIGKITVINTGLFLLWRLKGVPEEFLVKHFSFEKYNIRNNRYYTMITHTFSHFSFFSYLFNMLMLGTFGRNISLQQGNKYIWLLYLLGGFFGASCMNVAMPPSPYIVPQVGADASISAIITFFGLMNRQQTILLFFFPMRVWVLLLLMGGYSLMEPSKKNFGGMVAGLLIYQLFKIRLI